MSSRPTSGAAMSSDEVNDPPRRCHCDHPRSKYRCPGGIAKEINASDVDRFLAEVTPVTAAEQVRYDLAVELLDDIRRLDAQLKASHKRIRTAVAASHTTVTDLFGVGPVLAAMLIGYSGDIDRFATRDRYAAYNGTAPVEFSSGSRHVHRALPRGSRQLNHALHMVAICQTPPPRLRGPRLLRAARRGGQDQQGGPALAQAAPQQRGLPPARRRRRPHPTLSGPGRTTGHDS